MLETPHWSTLSVLSRRTKPRSAMVTSLLLLVAIQSCFRRAPCPTMSAAPPAAGTGRVRQRGRRRPQPGNANCSYARFSSVLQDEISNSQQQQKCRDFAGRENKLITPAFEFADEAVSGTKLHRDGLDALLAAAELGQLNTVYFYSLSRLARESIIGMPILKRLVYGCRVRIVSVTEGVDSDREGWEILAQILLMQHERYVKELSASTFRGQEGNVANHFSNGDYCFGFSSVLAPGEHPGNSRRRKPKRVYQVDPEQAEWVRRVFYWFVVERRSIRWIARELNRLGAPKDHRSSTKAWRHQYVVRNPEEQKVHRHLAVGRDEDLSRSSDRPEIPRAASIRRDRQVGSTVSGTAADR